MADGLAAAPPLVAGARGKKLRWAGAFKNDKKKESQANLLLGNERTFLGWYVGVASRRVCTSLTPELTPGLCHCRFSSCDNLLGFGTSFITFFNAGWVR